MAMKIRCTECRKKISIDEAFAGGMCRCPYCKALVFVPEEKFGAPVGGRAVAPGARPDAPQARPEAPGMRPAEPGAAAPAGAVAAEADHEHIPMARPVKIQGIITIVLLVLLLLMVAGGVVITLMYIQPKKPSIDVPDEQGQGPGLVQVAKEPRVGKAIKLSSPVVYVLDGTSSMRVTFDMGRVLLLKSVESLRDKVTFNVLLCREDEDRWLSPDFQAGGPAGSKAVEEFLLGTAPSGASDIPRALKAALEKKPKAIVLIARKEVDDANSVAGEAKNQGVVIHTIAVDGDPSVNASMKKLSEQTGGQSEELYPYDF